VTIEACREIGKCLESRDAAHPVQTGAISTLGVVSIENATDVPGMSESRGLFGLKSPACYVRRASHPAPRRSTAFWARVRVTLQGSRPRVGCAAALALILGAAISVPGAAADSHAGSIQAYGLNDSGQLGVATGNGTDAANPLPTVLDLPSTGVTRMAVGFRHSLVVRSGDLYAFGSNEFGQLGTAVNSGTKTANPTPVRVTLPGAVGRVTEVAAGSEHSLAVTESGQLYAFGLNQSGQLGVPAGSDTYGPNPLPALVTLPGQVGGVVQVAAGSFHSLALTASGQLYGFGDNFYAQAGTTTGNGTGDANPTPALVMLPGQVGAITDIAAGNYDGMALTASGQLYTFGINYYGKLGRPDNVGTIKPNLPAPAILPASAGGVTLVGDGGSHTLVETTSGQLYAFGFNSHGQVGAPPSNDTAPVPVALPEHAQGVVTHLAAGQRHSVIVMSSGAAYAFGSNRYGQLGSKVNAGTDAANPAPTYMEGFLGTKIGAVAEGADANHALLLVSDLSIFEHSYQNYQEARVGVRYRANVYTAGGTEPMRWSAAGLPPGLTFDAAKLIIDGTPTRHGLFEAAITVSDANGTVVTDTFQINVQPKLKPPLIRGRFTQSAIKWRAGRAFPKVVATAKAPAGKGGLPVGTRFSFRLDRPARLTLAFTTITVGRRVEGHGCVVKTAGNAGKPSCTRDVAEGSVRVHARPGMNHVRFEGRLKAGRKLGPGVHTVSLHADGYDGYGYYSNPREFTIVPA
jgi:alpha-tubulin suppressor-like RCC1 family protein